MAEHNSRRYDILEPLFNKLARALLKEIRVCSIDELMERTYYYFSEIDKLPVIFRWKYKMNETVLHKN